MKSSLDDDRMQLLEEADRYLSLSCSVSDSLTQANMLYLSLSFLNKAEQIKLISYDNDDSENNHKNEKFDDDDDNNSTSGNILHYVKSSNHNDCIENTAKYLKDELFELERRLNDIDLFDIGKASNTKLRVSAIQESFIILSAEAQQIKIDVNTKAWRWRWNTNDANQSHKIEETINSNTSEYNLSDEAIKKLLNCINILNEENTILMKRNELLEESNRIRITKEMLEFKNDFAHKFRKLRIKLHEFGKNNANNPLLTKDLNDTESNKRNESLENNSNNDSSIQRQEQLERMVQALLSRLEQATIAIDAKDKTIIKYEKYLRQLESYEADTNDDNRNDNTIDK